MAYSTVIYSPSTFACIQPLLEDITRNVKHASDKGLTVSVAKGIIVMTANTLVDEKFQGYMTESFNKMLGYKNFVIKFNTNKPYQKYDYVKYL